MNECDSSYGCELELLRLSGTIQVPGDPPEVQEFDNLAEMKLEGRYLSISLLKLFVNAQLRDDWSGNQRRFCLLQVLIQNKWDYLIASLGSGQDSIRMVDSEGFQHSENDEWVSFTFPYSMLLPDKRETQYEFRHPQWKLESGAKTKGWIWLDSLDAGVLPHKFSFDVRTYEPGATTGFVRDTDLMRFTIENYRIRPTQNIR